MSSDTVLDILVALVYGNESEIDLEQKASASDGHETDDAKEVSV